MKTLKYFGKGKDKATMNCHKKDVSPSGRPRWVFVFNPFYKGPDPMKELMWEIENSVFYRW